MAPVSDVLRACALRSLALGLVLLVAALSGVAAPALARPVPIGAAEELADRLADGSAHALIIGVSDFDEGRAWRALPGVPVEVAQVAGALQAQGFTVRIARDGGRMTKAEIRKEVRGFIESNGGRPESRLVIYFATHGYREPGEGGHGLLIASDTLSRGTKALPPRPTACESCLRTWVRWRRGICSCS